MSCRWDREREAYVDRESDQECKPSRDEYGDPMHHCAGKRSCSIHIRAGELTCPRCISRTRHTIRRIREIAPLMLPVAIGAGVNSEAANLAGPGTDPRGWSQRRLAMFSHLDTWQALGRITEDQHTHALALMPDDDELHPYALLTRWQLMLSEDYGQPLPAVMTVVSAADYLERNLARIANDEEQDYGLFHRELKACLDHMEAVLHTSLRPERGKRCPTCQEDQPEKLAPRLRRNYGHWCEDDGCEKVHYSLVLDKLSGEWVPDTSGDWWSCPAQPKNPRHQWTHESYRKWADERRAS